MMPETCSDKSLVINIRLVASCWFLSLHPTFMMNGHKSLKLWCFLWRCGPTRAMASSFLRFLDHTHNDTSQSVVLLWTSDQLVAESSTWLHTTLTTYIHAPGEIRTHNLSRRAAAHLRLRPHAHWERPDNFITVSKTKEGKINFFYYLAAFRNTSFREADLLLWSGVGDRALLRPLEGTSPHYWTSYWDK